MNALKAILLILTACLTFPPLLFPGDNDWRKRASSTGELSKDDIPEEIRFGREVGARLLGKYGLYHDPSLMKYVNLVGRSLARNTDRPEIEFRFAVIDTNEINAFAAPGGYVFLTRGALALMKDESELAGVLAHELAHITGRHIVKELNIRGAEDSPVAGLARLIGGSSEAARVAFAQAVDKAMDILFKDGYRREDEIQADKASAVYCALSGYDPSGLVRYLERIAAMKKRQTEVLDKTHPPYSARVAVLKETITAEGMDSGGFKAYKERFSTAVKGLR
jgi:predicted Zn-dependent protease